MGAIMASGKRHDRACVTLTIGLVAAASAAPVALGFYPSARYLAGVAAAGVGLLSGHLLSPDLDINSIPTDRWRRVGLYSMWGIYRDLIPYHRHWASHIPVISTALRVLYLSIWIAALCATLVAFAGFWGADISGVLRLKWLALNSEFIALIARDWFIGLCVADFGHWVLDGCPVRYRRSRRRRK